MKNLFITKGNLEELIKNLKKDCDEFIAPKKEHLDDIVFSDTKYSGGEILDYDGNSIVSPRAFLLPQTEVLFEIISAKGSKFKAIEDKTKRVFYGVRPCDIKAITLMRDFFTDKFVDAFYKQKMEHATFIALACTKPCSLKSFCYEMDAGPIAKNGFDLELTPVSMGYLVDIGSKKAAEYSKRIINYLLKVRPRL